MTASRATASEGASGGAAPAATLSGKAKGDQVLDILRARIARHTLAPGSKLREAELADEFGISRARVHEIFGALEQRGLIKRVPHRGAVVVRLDQKQAADLFNVREMLEALATRLATENAPAGSWDDLVERFHAPELEAELADGRFETYMDTLEALRERMILHADNEVLSNMLDQIYDKAMVVARRVIILPHRWNMALACHRDLIQAMARRDAAEAELIRRKIISSAREALERYRAFVL